MFVWERESARVFQLAVAGTSVEIVGPRWSGRTEILRRVGEQFRQAGMQPIIVRGIGSRLPMEALRSALPPVANASAGSSQQNSSPAAAIARLTQLRPTAILIDDGDRLDEASWVVLESVHKAIGTPLVSATLRKPAIDPDDRLLINFAHPVVRISLDDLPLDSVHSLLEDHLGSAIAPSLSGRIHTKSSGIAGFALAIANAAMANGKIRRQGDLLVDGPDLWSPELEGAYEGLLFTFAPDIREAVETIALAGTVSLATAKDLLGQELLETLESHGLVRVFATQDKILVAVNPPGIGDYFRNQPTSAHRLRIIETITSKLHAETSESDGSAQAYLDTLPSRPLANSGNDQLPLIARMFREGIKFDLASSFNEWVGSRTAANANLFLARQLSGTFNVGTITRVLRETSLADASPEDELIFRHLRSRSLVASGGSVEDCVAALLDDVRDDFEHAEALESLALAVAIEKIGIDPAFEATLRSRIDGGTVSADVSRLVLVYTLILSSRAAEASALIAERRLPHWRLADAQFAVARGLALYASGHHAEAAAWAREHTEAAVASLDRPALVGHAYISVLSLAALGRFDEAIEASSIMLSAEITGSSTLFAPDRAMMHALALVALRMARNSIAEGFLERAERFSGFSDALPIAHVSFTDAAAASADGEVNKGGRLYRKTADLLRKRGYELAADGATMLSLITSFDSTLAASFLPRARMMGGPLYAAYLEGRDASQRNDADGLISAARILRDNFAGDEALRFFTHAMTVYRDSGKHEQAAGVRAEVRDLLQKDDSMSARTIVHPAANAGLTAREAEIASYIRAGLANAEIASRFGLSVRTVETHLRNIRRKTGAVDRDDIASFGLGAVHTSP